MLRTGAATNIVAGVGVVKRAGIKNAKKIKKAVDGLSISQYIAVFDMD